VALGISSYLAFKIYRKMTVPAVRKHIVVGERGKNEIKVLSYNMLADIYTDESHAAHLNMTYIDFKRRSELIRKEISTANPDIICLQELDHEEVYLDYLQRLGYKFVTESRRGKDAVLIGWNDKFKLIESYGVQHDALTEKFSSENEKSNDFERGNCSVYATLQHKENGKQFQVISTH
jgi:mRNA deadenylase 3'-5' endonuclease subunit Ccr4